MKLKKALIIIISFVWIGAALAAGVWLVGRKQLLQKKASVPEGIATVRFDPETAIKNSGEILTVQIPFDTAGEAISGITAIIDLSGGDGMAPFIVIGVQPNSVLANAGLDYRVTTFTDLSVDISAISLEDGGFTPSGEVSLATVSLLAQAPGTTTAVFDPARSMITRSGAGGDILLTPQSIGTYTVAGGGSPTLTPTPTPTETESEPTGVPTVTPTSEPIPTESAVFPEPEPEPEPTLPVAGSAVQTAAILMLGLALVVGSSVYLAGRQIT